MQRGGDVTFWNLFFSPKNCPPPTPPPPQLVSFTVLCFRIDGSLSRLRRKVRKGIFALPNPPPQDVLLACGRELWRWGTRLHPAVEMAVSIKYHFQFPCFMIPGLLSTNNAPPPPRAPTASAGPPTLSWRRLITLVASYKKDIYMKIRKQLLCLHGSESRTKAIPNLIFIHRRGEITISWRLIWVSFGGRARGGGGREDVCRLNKAGKLFSCYIDGCCLHSHNEDVADSQAENMSVERSCVCVFAPKINRI